MTVPSAIEPGASGTSARPKSTMRPSGGRVDEYVRGFHVAVNQADGMSRRQPVGRLGDQLGRLAWGQPGPLAKHLRHARDRGCIPSR